jgi:hypothetical protein
LVKSITLAVVEGKIGVVLRFAGDEGIDLVVRNVDGAGGHEPVAAIRDDQPIRDQVELQRIVLASVLAAGDDDVAASQRRGGMATAVFGHRGVLRPHIIVGV